MRKLLVVLVVAVGFLAVPPAIAKSSSTVEAKPVAALKAHSGEECPFEADAASL